MEIRQLTEPQLRSLELMSQRPLHPPSKRGLIGAYVLIGVGLLCWLQALDSQSRIDTPVPNAPIDLSRPGRRILNFRTRAAEHHEVRLSSPRNAAVDFGEHQAHMEAIRLAVSIAKDGRALRLEERSGLIYSGEAIDRSLAWFQAEADTDYQLIVTVEEASPLLAQSGPSIRIRVPLAIGEFHGLNMALFTLLAVVLGGVGLWRFCGLCLGALVRRGDLPDFVNRGGARAR